MKDKVVLVTGGYRGLGEAICRLLGAEGARVAVNHRHSEQAAELADHIRRQHGALALPVAGDVSSESDVQTLFDKVEDRLGPIDALVKPEQAESSVPTPDSGGLLHVEETGEVETYRLPLTADRSSLHYHVENFLQAIRGKARLNCPAKTALASEAAVLRALEAVEAKQQLPIPAEDA